MLTCVAIWALCLQSYSHAFVVTTNIQNAIQYMKQTIYTTSWGQQWTTQVAVNTWAAGWVIYMQTAAWTPLVCDSTGNWCKSISSLVTGNMTNGTIPMATNTTSLANSLLRQVGPKVIVDWTLSTVWNLEVKNGKVSALSYCDATETNCRSGNDLYTKAQIDNLLAFSYYSTWNTYSKNYIDANLVQTWTLLNNYHTRTYIDGTFYPRTYIDWNLVTSWFLTTNYYTRGYIDANTYTQTHIQGNYLTSGQIMNGFSSVMSFLTWNYYDRTTIDSYKTILHDQLRQAIFLSRQLKIHSQIVNYLNSEENYDIIQQICKLTFIMYEQWLLEVLIMQYVQQPTVWLFDDKVILFHEHWQIVSL